MGSACRPAPVALALGVVLLQVRCGGSGPPPPPPAPAAAPRNLLLISIDTLRADRVGAYGRSPSITPSIDALAARGATYLEARTAVPLTLPSHAVMMTGRLPAELGVRDNGEVLGEDAETVAETLAARGYACAAFVGAAVLARRHGLAQGFSVYDDEMPGDGGILVTPERRADAVVARTRAWLDRPAAEPFFLFVHLFDPHAAYAAPEPFASRHEPYDAEIAYVDAAVGRLVEALGGRSGRTIVAVVSDHGESLGEHGERTHGLFLYDATLRVPLIVVAPDAIPAGTRVSGPARLVDLRTTLLSLLGLPAEPGARPLWPVTGARLAEAPTYAETLFPYLNFRWSGSQAMVAGGRKLIRSNRPELYDLGADPAEARDLLAAAGACDAACTAAADSLGLQIEQVDATAKVATAPDAETVETLRSLGYLSSGADRPPAVAASERLALPDPKDRISLFARYDAAIEELHARRYDAGIAILEEIVAADPGNVLALSFLGAAAYESGELERSRKAYERALAEAPARGDLHALLARTLAKQGREDDALTHAGKALASDPGSTVASLVVWDVERKRSGGEARALAAIENAVRADPGNPVVELPLVETYLAGGDLAGARAHLESVLTRSPRHARALTLRGVLKARAGDREAALADFRAAVEAAPDSPQALVGLATAEAQAGRLDDALAHYERALQLGHDVPDLLNAMAFTYLQAGRPERARELLARSLAQAPDQPQARALLAQVEGRSGK